MTHSFRLSIYLDFTDFKFIGRYICSSVHPKMETDFMQTVNLLTIELRIEESNNLLSIFFEKSLKKSYLFFKTALKSSFDGRYWPCL